MQVTLELSLFVKSLNILGMQLCGLVKKYLMVVEKCS